MRVSGEMIFMYTCGVVIVTLIICTLISVRESKNNLDLNGWILDRNDRELRRRLSRRKRLFDSKRLNYLDSEIRRLEWRRIRAKYVLSRESELIDKMRAEYDKLENDIAAAIKRAKSDDKKEA